MGLSQPASQSAVLLSAQPCSDNESPPGAHSLSGSSPIPSFKKEKQRLFYAVFYLAEDMGLSQPASQSAVLRSAHPCSDNESPPETHSLSGSSPIPSFKKEKQRLFYAVFYLAEDMGLEPTRLLHPTRFPGELLSHSVNPPHRFYIFAMRNSLRYKMSVPF